MGLKSGSKYYLLFPLTWVCRFGPKFRPVVKDLYGRFNNALSLSLGTSSAKDVQGISVLTYLGKEKAVPLNYVCCDSGNWANKIWVKLYSQAELTGRYKDWRTANFCRTYLPLDSQLYFKSLTTWGNLIQTFWTYLILMANERLAQPLSVRWVKSCSGGMLEEELPEEETSGHKQRHKSSAQERTDFALQAKPHWRSPVQARESTVVTLLKYWLTERRNTTGTTW